MTRFDAYVEDRLRDGERARCGHLKPCACDVLITCCLYCPFFDCRYGQLRGIVTLRNVSRDAAIVAMKKDRATVASIVEVTGVGRRTVFRALAKAKEAA
ncbi:hypothetical protein LCGC14_0968960 [marine sediment metagenome]|uniref:Resolvase HTH domain-containing protein n=1 Tax=marine sediment metagenome TaxID=412755 RepID=A0A0F9NC97_9ZZZZ